MTRKLTLLFLLQLLLAACGGSGDSSAISGPAPPPPSPTPVIAVQPAFTQLSFSQPLWMAQAPGDGSNWYVAERGGVIRIFPNDPNTPSSNVFLDIDARVDSSAGEGGLLGVAFHPDYPVVNEVYVSYTSNNGGLISNVSRFLTLDGGLTLNAATEEILLQVAQPRSNHNGGNLAFGPDGFLYAGFGDGGGSGDPDGFAQDKTNLHGSIVRIDVDGSAPFDVPGDNPFAGNANCVQGFGSADCPEIFAWGLRNPWRFSFDRNAGTLWVADVGQGDWEEVNRVALGDNLGWNIREGAHCFPPGSSCSDNFIDPVTEYDHSLGQSITGGYVYRGSAVSALAGWYVFGDFVSGRLFAVAANAAMGTSPDELLDTSLSIASFAEDIDGELYIVDFGGTLHQLVAP